VTETYPREFYQHFQSGPLDAPKEHEPSNTPRISEEERASIEATLAGLIAVARAVGYTNDDLIELLQRGILRRAD
jgi:DNA-binding transcriptional regulator YhcF (GntR family)